MTDSQTPESREALREQIEEAAMYGFIEGAYDVHGIPVQSVDKLEDLITAATLASNKAGRMAEFDMWFGKYLMDKPTGDFTITITRDALLRRQKEFYNAELASLERQQLGKDKNE